MNCMDCPALKIVQNPIKADGGGYWDLGLAKCERHGLYVEFPDKGKLKRLKCVEEEKPELVSGEKI